MGSRRIPALRQTAERIEELLAGGGDHDVRSDLIRLGVRKLVEEMLEAEVEDRLGRAYYHRGDGESSGYRNGYRRGGGGEGGGGEGEGGAPRGGWGGGARGRGGGREARG